MRRLHCCQLALPAPSSSTSCRCGENLVQYLVEYSTDYHMGENAQSLGACYSQEINGYQVQVVGYSRDLLLSLSTSHLLSQQLATSPCFCKTVRETCSWSASMSSHTAHSSPFPLPLLFLNQRGIFPVGSHPARSHSFVPSQNVSWETTWS